MRTVLTLVIFMVLVAAFAAPVTRADVPESMNVQGRLTDAAGDPASPGLKNFTFRIFNQQVGGTEIWPGGAGELQTLATDADGLWNANLGVLIALPPPVFQDSSRWLQVTVDDGVNPAETLPRIKLNTNPYSFRAASAQDADALGGLSATDLQNMFVDESGDVMSGNLSLNDGTPAITLDLRTSAFLGYRDDGSLNTRLGSNSPSSFLQLYGANVERVFLNGGSSYGFLGLADGDGDRTIALRANTTTGGTINIQQEDDSPGIYLRGGSTSNGATLQMYSAGGSNTISLDADLTGNAAAVLPAGSIYDAEILDEPGVAQALPSSASLTTNGTVVNVGARTISCPTSGYVVVWATAQVNVSHTSGGGQSTIDFGVSNSSTTFPSDQDKDMGVPSGAPSGTYYLLGSAQKIFSVGSGNRTFYLLARKNSGNTHTVSASTLSLLFVPTSYGTVSAVVAASQAGEFENAKERIVTQPDGEGQTTRETVYEVDLRDLELRAARAEAEAERARCELREAELAAERSQGDNMGNSTPSETGHYE